MSDSPREVLVFFDEIVALLRSVFVKAGVAERSARILALNCAMCERDGSKSHGIFRIPGYVASLRGGWVDGCAIPSVEDAGTAFLRVDARNGFAQPALAAARRALLDQVRRTGVSVVAIRNSHHFSALWPDVEPLARDGLVAITFVSGLACVAPVAGGKPVLGTNPIAFAVPVKESDPFVFDQATSALSNGDVRIAAREAKSLPADSGVDCRGRPTTDPNAVLNGGALLPFGGHKGASIALMVEILASALTGGQFSFEVDFSGHPGAETPKTGQLLIAIDPQRGGNSAFPSRVRQLVNCVREAGQSRLPGDRRYSLRKTAESSQQLLVNVKQLDALRSFE